MKYKIDAFFYRNYIFRNKKKSCILKILLLVIDLLWNLEEYW